MALVDRVGGWCLRWSSAMVWAVGSAALVVVGSVFARSQRLTSMTSHWSCSSEWEAAVPERCGGCKGIRRVRLVGVLIVGQYAPLLGGSAALQDEVVIDLLHHPTAVRVCVGG